MGNTEPEREGAEVPGKTQKVSKFPNAASIFATL